MTPLGRAVARAVLGLFSAPRVNMREDYGRVRRLQRGLAALPAARYRIPSWGTITDASSRDVPLRVFSPRRRHGRDVLLFLHGGGWVTGDIESYTPACAALADATGCAVVSVDYRLAPEHPFPAGLEDCLQVTRLLLEEPARAGIEGRDRVVLVGDSAGANLAAVVSRLLREQGVRPPSRQILLYPVTHWDHDPATSPFDSVRRYGEGLRLTAAEVQDYLAMYVPDPAGRTDPRVAPLLAEDLSDQPRTLLLSAGRDLLRDEGEAYGDALAAAGNDVQVHRVEGALHGFLMLPRLARPVREAYEVIAAFLEEPGEGP